MQQEEEEEEEELLGGRRKRAKRGRRPRRVGLTASTALWSGRRSRWGSV